MKTITTLLTLSVLFVAASSLSAATAKSYQVTGPVLAVGSSSITVQKGTEKWEISADAKTLGTVKVGDKVTVYYTMVAKSVEVKPAADSSAAKAAAPSSIKSTKN